MCVTGTGNGSPAVGVGNSGGTSEYVRNELRAVVGARSARPDLHPLQPPDMENLMSFDMSAPGKLHAILPNALYDTNGKRIVRLQCE